MQLSGAARQKLIGQRRTTMGRKRVLLLFLIFLFVLLCGCRATETAALPQLVIGYDNYRPYTYTDADGEPAGIDVELAREACRRMGYEPVFRHIDWGNRDNALESGAIDCLWSCFSMETDSENYAWVGPYMYSRQVVAVAESSDLKSLSDLAGKSIAVRLSSQAESALLGGTDSRIPALGHVYSLRNADEVITALRSGYVDACAGYAYTHGIFQDIGREHHVYLLWCFAKQFCCLCNTQRHSHRLSTTDSWHDLVFDKRDYLFSKLLFHTLNTFFRPSKSPDTQ